MKEDIIRICSVCNRIKTEHSSGICSICRKKDPHAFGRNANAPVAEYIPVCPLCGQAVGENLRRVRVTLGD